MPDSAPEVHRIVTGLIKLMVDSPEAVTVDLADGVTLQVRVAEADFGKIVGTGGRNARAIRTIVAAIAKAQGRSFLVNIESHT